MNTKRNYCLDQFKGIAALLVVVNHFHANGLLGDIEYVISNIGVPLFFLVSGYYIYNCDSNKISERLPKKIQHSFSLALIWFVLYFSYNTYQIYAIHGYLDQELLADEVSRVFTYSAFKEALLYGGSFFGIGHWFLMCLLIAYIVFYVLYRIHAKDLIEKYGLFLVFLGFLVHIPLRVLLLLNGFDTMIGLPLDRTIVVRNVWFDAIPFMIIGFQINKNRSRIDARLNQKHDNLLLGIMLLGVTVSVFEMLFTNHLLGYNLNCVLYVGTIISAVAAFLYAARNPEGVKGLAGKGLTFLGHISIYIYFIHPIVGTELSVRWESYEMMDLHLYSVSVLLISVLLATIIYFVVSKFKSLMDKPYKVV